VPNVKLVLEYDGTGFHGWQHQPGLRTIQGELQRVLEMVLREPLAEVTAAGRTDSGVHARGQVVNFHVSGRPDLDDLARSVNAILRGELSVLHAEFAPETFHATFHALRKCYLYTILNRAAPPTFERNRVWHLRFPLDIERMRREAAALVGRLDFRSFQGPKCTAKSSVRSVLSSEILHEPPYVRYRIIGEGFIKQMVRNITGTLAMFGTGRMRAASMHEVLAACDRRAGGVTAPPQGLCMEWVEYPEGLG